jgi:hypothetical protein
LSRANEKEGRRIRMQRKKPNDHEQEEHRET